MTSCFDREEGIFRALVNHEDQYSICPEWKAIPGCWRDTGTAGDKKTCLGHIEKVWTDMRPLSLRRFMEERIGCKPIMPTPLTLFSLPCVAASAVMYLRWRQKLPSWIRIQPIGLPVRGGRLHEAPEKTFAMLAARLCDEFEMNPSQRYAFFGHSMGALLAYRITHHLHARMRPLPGALLVSACAAPSRQDWKRYADKDSDTSLIADLRKQAGTPEEVFQNPELLSMTLGLLGADLSYLC